MLSQKEQQILRYLMKKKDRFVSSQELAVHLSCSDRTVRTYVKQLMEELSDCTEEVAICAKQGYGYQLAIKNPSLYQELVEEQDTPQACRRSGNRYAYILNKLLFEQAEIYFDDLAEELFVSRSTLSYEFKKIRKDLMPYALSVESKANKGVYIKGEERNKRRFIMDYFFRDRFFKKIHHYIDADMSQLPISLEELTLIVVHECREAELRLSDFAIQNVVVHIALALRRVQEGFQVASMKELGDKQYPKEYKVARKILNRIHQVTGIACPKEEADYLALHFVSKVSLLPIKASDQEVEERVRKELIAVLDRCPSGGSCGFQEDSQLLDGVCLHLMTMLVRLQTNVHLENPLLEEMKEHYRSEFDMTRGILERLPLFSDYAISEHEVAYVTLHFMAAMERMCESRRHRVLVICATGYGSAQLLRNRIERELGNLVQIVDVIGYYELSDESLEQVDCIISSIDLSNLIFSIPVFTVSIFFTEAEVKRIKEALKEWMPATIGSEKGEKEEVEWEALFDAYFSERYFLVEEGLDKEAVLEKLAQSLTEGECEGTKEQLLEAITQREQMSSVVFSPHVAVPHPIKPMTKRHGIGLAIIRQGVAWTDEAPSVNLVFLPCPSIYENEGLASLTNQIVALLEDRELQKQMVASPSFATFRRLFLQIGRSV